MMNRDEVNKGGIPYFKLRVLLRFEEAYKVFAGYCLETGNVVTADDMDTAIDIMKEVLEDEIYNAVKFENYGNLFSKPAPKSIWDSWYKLSKIKTPERMNLNPRIERVNLNDEETPTRVDLVSAQ